METDTHIIHTVKWKKSLYPMVSDEYNSQSYPGEFLHNMLSTREIYLSKCYEYSIKDVIEYLIEIKKIIRDLKLKGSCQAYDGDLDKQERTIPEEKIAELERFLITFVSNDDHPK